MMRAATRWHVSRLAIVMAVLIAGGWSWRQVNRLQMANELIARLRVADTQEVPSIAAATQFLITIHPAPNSEGTAAAEDSEPLPNRWTRRSPGNCSTCNSHWRPPTRRSCPNWFKHWVSIQIRRSPDGSPCGMWPLFAARCGRIGRS